MAEPKPAKSLPTNEDQFRAFMDSSPLFAWAKDTQGRYVYVNKTYESSFGSRMDNWRGKSDFEIWSPETAERFRKNDVTVLDQQRIINDVETLTASEGGQSYLICKFPFQDESGNPLVGGIGVDISEQKRLEAELRRSEQRFQTLSDLALEGVIIHDAHRVVDANAAAPRILGYEREEFIGCSPTQFLTPQVPKGEPTRNFEDCEAPFETRVVRKDGSLAPVEITSRPITADGRLRVTVLRDLTERKKAEQVQRIEHERKRLESVILSLTEGVFLIGPDGAILSANPAAARMHQWEALDASPGNMSEATTIAFCERLDGTPMPLEEWPATRALQGEVVLGVEMRVRNLKTGHTWVASYGAAPVRGEHGEIIMAVVSVRDTTAEHAANEEIRRANLALHELSGRLLRMQDEERKRIARDIHDGTVQMITALSMNLLLIGNSPGVVTDPETRKLIAEAQDLGKRCSRDLRTLSYLLYPPDLDELGLAPALRSWADGFATPTGIALEMTIDDPGRLDSDTETTLFRIAQEALANVQKHSGSPRAEVVLRPFEGGILLEVRDHGRGVSPGTLTRNPQPLGVGIMGMRERARQLGGTLQIVCDGSGTVVRAILPRRAG